MIRGSVYKEISPNVWRTLWQFTCDYCQLQYERTEKRERRNKPTHYCSIKCANEAQKSGGVLDARRRDQFRQKLGVDYPQQSQVVRNKSIQTCQTRYGVNNVQQISDVKRRSCDTFLKRLEKRQRTLGVWTSKAENSFYDFLCIHFNADDIIRQKRIETTRRPIDFYIKSIDTYIQFDGIYWHGLNRPLDVIRECKNRHDQEIAVRWLNDREQDTWFREHNLKLVRITDQQFDTMTPEEILGRIHE